MALTFQPQLLALAATLSNFISLTRIRHKNYFINKINGLSVRVFSDPTIHGLQVLGSIKANLGKLLIPAM